MEKPDKLTIYIGKKRHRQLLHESVERKKTLGQLVEEALAAVEAWRRGEPIVLDNEESP